ncbi:MAG: membrane protein insertion efficiency factor YidD [bacterium]
MKATFKFLLYLYRKVPRGQNCRFYPSCSYYAEEALEKHGLLKGCFLALKRIIKCNQWFPGGFDPVSEN